MNYHTFRATFESLACFSTKQVMAVYPDFQRDNYSEWISHGYLVKVRRGWYAFADSERIPGICDYIAGKIYAPSYLSCEYVLSRSGIIPESVVQLTSVTSLKTISFKNAFGEFCYRSVKPELMFGYEVETVGGGLPALVAAPEKAICDFLYLNPQYKTREDLEELRFDEEVLAEVAAGERLDAVVERFSCKALRQRVALMKEVYGL